MKYELINKQQLNMKYELINKSVSQEIDIYENDVKTDNYKAIITIGLHPTDGIAPDFSKDIEVISSNLQNGFEVDEQREQAIQDYLNLINQ